MGGKYTFDEDSKERGEHEISADHFAKRRAKLEKESQNFKKMMIDQQYTKMVSRF